MPNVHRAGTLKLVLDCEPESSRHSATDLVRARGLMSYRRTAVIAPERAENEALRRKLERAEAELAQQREVLGYLMQRLAAPATPTPARTYFAHLAEAERIEVGRTQMTSELMAELVADD